MQAPPKSATTRAGSCSVRASLNSAKTRSVLSFCVREEQQANDLDAVVVGGLRPDEAGALAVGFAAQLAARVDDVLAFADDGEEAAVGVVEQERGSHFAATKVE